VSNHLTLFILFFMTTYCLLSNSLHKTSNILFFVLTLLILFFFYILQCSCVSILLPLHQFSLSFHASSQRISYLWNLLQNNSFRTSRSTFREPCLRWTGRYKSQLFLLPLSLQTFTTSRGSQDRTSCTGHASVSRNTRTILSHQRGVYRTEYRYELSDVNHLSETSSEERETDTKKSISPRHPLRTCIRLALLRMSFRLARPFLSLLLRMLNIQREVSNECRHDLMQKVRKIRQNFLDIHIFTNVIWIILNNWLRI